MTPEEIEIMSLPKMQEKFRERMGGLHKDDKQYFVNGQFIRLPIPIDPENPSRGLLGMLEQETLRGLYPSMFDHQSEWTCRVHKNDTSIFYDGETPTLALLLALAHQWGIEVKP